MGRTLANRTDYTEYIRGNDHVVGQFLQITDSRYAESKQDHQGEGYVLDWDSMFKFSTNLIGATTEDLVKGPDALQLKVEAFIKSLKD